MESTSFKMTLFQHALNPIICLGMSDGNFTNEELTDLIASTAQLAKWFNITPEQAKRECEQLHDHLRQEMTVDAKAMLLRVPISCALVHKNVKEVEPIDYIIRFLEDQATADGKLTDEESQLVNQYTTILRLGGKAAGIHV